MDKLSVRHGLLAFVAALLATGAVAACSALDASSLESSVDGGSSGDARANDGATAEPFADAGAFLEANAIVLVHAAAFPAFRVCFDGALDELPQPSKDLMPESNVVGVDVGTAVRLPARGGMLGTAYVFPEAKIRTLYPAGVGPTCGELLNATGIKENAIAVGEVTASLDRGVHALVLQGCRPTSADPIASKARCGDDWTAAAGNLRLRTLSLMAYPRSGDARLSVQLVQLSPALQGLSTGRALGLAYGPLDAGNPMPFVEGAVPFGEAVPNPPAALDYAAADLGAYGTNGVFVTLGGALDDGGSPVDAGGDAARDVVFAQSLADIQKRSSPRSLPLDWFSFAASYALLSVGDTDPRLGDGGPDDDPRRALHLLAIPLATPDAGDPDASTN